MFVYTQLTAPEVGAVLFDLDGTLVVTHIDFPAMRGAVIATVEAAGLPRAEYERLDMLTMVARAAETLRAQAGEAAAQRLVVAAEEVMVDAEMRALHGAGPTPYAAEVLTTLAERGVGIAIVTRNCRRATEAALALIGLSCPVILTRDDVTRFKPDPAHLFAATERLNVDPSTAVMVGDHLMDIQGRARCRDAHRRRAHRRPASDYFDAEGPDLVANDLRELPVRPGAS